jgi:NADH:ubiquinone oxidoreductase subunit E
MNTEIEHIKQKGAVKYQADPKHTIRICLGSACYSKAKHENLEYIEAFLKENGLLQRVDFRGHLCIEQCQMGPNVEIDGKMYHEVNCEKLKIILPHHFMMKAE